MNLVDYEKLIHSVNAFKWYGKVQRVIGLLIESVGPVANIGDVCLIYTEEGKEPILSEVVGFNNENILLMPYGEIQEIGPGCLVESTGEPLTIKTGHSLIGQVVDPLGKPLNQAELPRGLTTVLTEMSPPNPLNRPRITEKFQVGVKAIDSLLTVGKGQRIGIFAGSGVGKSTLLGMIARNSSANVNVIALIGERGREVLEFIEKDLGDEGLKNSVVVVATSDQPALMRLKAATTATRIAEYFRDEGYEVNLMMDSVTRVAMAQREIGLAIGEPPTTKGYTPSVFSLLPRILERTGTSLEGTITAFYTVLVDGDDMNEPIADTVRGILDGHFILSRTLAERAQFPAIDVLKSVSRVMNQIADPEHLELAKRVRNLLALYEENRELIQIGAYKKGTNAQIDEAIHYYEKLQAFLRQDTQEMFTLEETVVILNDLLLEV